MGGGMVTYRRGMELSAKVRANDARISGHPSAWIVMAHTEEMATALEALAGGLGEAK